MKNKGYYVFLAIFAVSVVASFLIADSSLHKKSIAVSDSEVSYNDGVQQTVAGQYCGSPAALSAHWCSMAVAVSSCKAGCGTYNSANGCGGPNWNTQCKSGCTGAAGCNALY